MNSWFGDLLSFILCEYCQDTRVSVIRTDVGVYIYVNRVYYIPVARSS